MDVREHLRNGLRAALAEAGIDPLPDDIALERPANRTTATGRRTSRRHREEGGQESARTRSGAGRLPHRAPPAHVTAVEIAGPGFVNFRLADTWLHEVMTDVLEQGVDGYASPDLGAGAHLNVEFVSANPNKPLHAGHGRGACYGDSIARLKERCGFVSPVRPTSMTAACR